MDSINLDKFEISKETVSKLNAINITGLYKIQSETFQQIRQGNDVVALAKTGSGKTLAFSLPIVELIQENIIFTKGRSPVVIILAPTRELVTQTSNVISSISSDSLSVLPIYGGVPYHVQVRALKGGTDIIVGTPGRVIDLINNNRLNLKSVKYVILDEVDRMLDMGFSADVETILSSLYTDINSKPQTMLFSATLPKWVSEISKKYISPKCHKVNLVNNKEARTADSVEHLAILCPYYERASTIADIIRVYSNGPTSRCIVFCERKIDADELASHTSMASDCHVFHGDIPQDKREFILQKFRDGKYHTLLTTNVAARGLDIPDVELVIQCAPPSSSEDYIHRSGRTGRAGRKGVSICFYKMNERQQLAFIERGAGITFRRISAPSTNDIVNVWAKELSLSFADMPTQAWEAFLPAARCIIEALTPDDIPDKIMSKKTKKSKKKSRSQIGDEEHEKENNEVSQEKEQKETGPNPIERALCCALAKISGKVKSTNSRSLLTAHGGLTAYKLEIPDSMTAHRKGLAYSLLNNHIPNEITNTIRNLAFIKGRKGFVFDIPNENVEAVDQYWKDDDKLKLAKLIELPELEPEPDSGNSDFGRGRFNFRGRGFGNRARGGFRGSRGGNFKNFRGSDFRSSRGRGSFAEKRPFNSNGINSTVSSPKVTKFDS